MAKAKPKKQKNNDAVDKKEALEKARQLKMVGGIIPALINKYGAKFAEFVQVDLLEKSMSPKLWVAELSKRFPEIPADEYPSVTATRDFRLKWLKAQEDQSPADSTSPLVQTFVDLKIMGQFNLVAERMNVYDRALEGFMILHKEMQDKKVLPERYYDALDKVSETLDKIDSLLVRFGILAPDAPKTINPMQFNFGGGAVPAAVDGAVTVDDEEFKIRARQMVVAIERKQQVAEIVASYPPVTK